MSMAIPSLPSAITIKRNGDYRVSLRPIGATNPVRITTKTVADAFEALAHGLRCQEQHGTADEIRTAMVDGVRAQRAASAPAKPDARLLGELMDTFLEERRAICANGNHKLRRNIKKGINSVRPGTVEAYENTINKHLRPRWGNVPVDQIDRQLVSNWVIEIAKNGLGLDTSTKAMIMLRKLVGFARRSELPEEYPWHEVEALRPVSTTRPSRDPEVWGGDPTSKPPAMPIPECMRLFRYLPAATLCLVLMERFMGTRVGETCGALLEDLTYDVHGVLRLHIHRQMDGKGNLVNYTKTDASYRTIPVPRLFAKFLDAQCLFYHDYDLHNPDPTRGHIPIMVNSAGRAIDGSFLPIRPTTVMQQLIDARVPAEMTHQELGFTAGNHYYRECFITELLNIMVILADLEREAVEEAPTDPVERVAYLEGLINRRHLTGYSPMHVSAYAGHEHDRATEIASASRVTLQRYNLSLNNDAHYVAISETMNRLIELTIGELVFEPDEWDLMPVHQIDDPEWCTVREAIELIGIQDSNVISAINDGRLEGHMGWQANGGYLRNEPGTGKSTPALPQLFASRTSVKEYIRKRSLVGITPAAKRFGMTDRPAWAILHQAGYRPEGSKWNPDSVDEVMRRLHELFLDALGDVPLSLTAIKQRIDATKPALLPDRRVTLGWLETWRDQLLEAKAITVTRDGWVGRRRV